MVTIFIGAMDFCFHMCFREDPTDILDEHREHLTIALEKLQKNLPRTIVNVVLQVSKYSMYASNRLVVPDTVKNPVTQRDIFSRLGCKITRKNKNRLKGTQTGICGLDKQHLLD